MTLVNAVNLQRADFADDLERLGAARGVVSASSASEMEVDGTGAFDDDNSSPARKRRKQVLKPAAASSVLDYRKEDFIFEMKNRLYRFDDAGAPSSALPTSATTATSSQPHPATGWRATGARAKNGLAALMAGMKGGAAGIG